MGSPNETSRADIARKPLWQRALVILGGSAAFTLFVLTFFPSEFELVSRMVARPISSAVASDGADFISPREARAQRLSRAKTAVHGMYVKDPYGCVYMFQYLSAHLTLVPVLDEHRQPVCGR